MEFWKHHPGSRAQDALKQGWRQGPSTREVKPETREAEKGKGSVEGTIISWLLGRGAGESWGSIPTAPPVGSS